MALGLIVTLAVPWASRASAESSEDESTVVCDGSGCHVVVTGGGGGGDGGPAGSNQSSGDSVDCRFGELGPEIDRAGYPEARDAVRDITGVVTELTEDFFYVTNCGGEHRIVQYSPGEPPVSPEFLAYRAHDAMTVAFPEPQTSPAIEHDHLVGLRTWLWIAPHGFEPVSASASIPGLSVTVTATATRVVWDMGDDSEPVVCDDPGTAYDTDRRPEDQDTDCFHVYQWHGDYTASATTTWEIEWSATNGDGGTFAAIDRTTSFDLHVVERQAVIVDNP